MVVVAAKISKLAFNVIFMALSPLVRWNTSVEPPGPSSFMLRARPKLLIRGVYLKDGFRSKFVNYSHIQRDPRAGSGLVVAELRFKALPKRWMSMTAPVCADDTVDDTQHLPHDGRSAGKQEPQRIREAEHPLAHGMSASISTQHAISIGKR